MKRTSEKESPTHLKKTKLDTNTKLNLPIRSSQEKLTPIVTSLTRPPVETETIVLSSDDEDELVLQNAIHAQNLNVPLSSAYLNRVEEAKKNIAANNSVHVNQQGERVQQDETTTKTNSSVNKKKHHKSKDSPGNVASAMDISNLDDDDEIEEELNVETNSIVNVEEDTEDDGEEDDVDVEGDYEDNDLMESKLLSDPVLSDFESVDLPTNEENQDKHTTDTMMDDMSEIDELQSDTDADADEPLTTPLKTIVQIPETVVEVQSMSDVETTEIKQSEDVDSDGTQMSFVKDRPVRAGRSVITTYNDIANSIDPEKLSYIVSDSDDNLKPVKTTQPKKRKPSPPKTMRAAVVLSKFTKELTSRRHLKTGFVYDTAMSYHATPNPMEIHPEDPRRIFKIFNILEQNGLLGECERINSRRATKEEILLVHNILHYRTIRETAGSFFFFCVFMEMINA